MTDLDLRLMCGDANEMIDRLITEGVKVDMIYTSPNPPFYTKDNPDPNETTTEGNIGNEEHINDYLYNLLSIFSKLRMVLKDTGHFWLHAGDYWRHKQGAMKIHDRIALQMTDKFGWILMSDIIWYRPEEVNIADLKRFRNDYEKLFWFTKTNDVDVYSKEYLNTSLIEAKYVLPQKWTTSSGYPEKLVYIPIKTCTEEGQTILDPFMGTGTTGMVALEMKRNFIGIELFPDKFKGAQERLSKA